MVLDFLWGVLEMGVFELFVLDPQFDLLVVFELDACPEGFFGSSSATAPALLYLLHPCSRAPHPCGRPLVV